MERAVDGEQERIIERPIGELRHCGNHRERNTHPGWRSFNRRPIDQVEVAAQKQPRQLARQHQILLDRVESSFRLPQRIERDAGRATRQTTLSRYHFG
ncbi:hypothetical protein DWU95_45310 [Burkholderia contaminans]|nr:hypothetical protein DWU95_45310 [Burkholderia contaminans]